MDRDCPSNVKSRCPMSTRPEAPRLGVLLREPFRVASAQLHERFAERGHPEVRAAARRRAPVPRRGGTRVSVLAERAQITKQSMADLVLHLERHGYVERVPDPTDGRAKLVRATARGRETYAIAREFVAELEAEWGRRIGADRMRALRELLEELNAVLA